MSNPALTNLLSNCKAEATVSPITIGSFPGSDRPLPCIATPSKTKESPDSFRSGTSSLLFFPNEPEVQVARPRRISRYQHHRRSLSENSLGLKAEDGAQLSPFKSPSALELMQQVARTHMKSPILTPGGTTRLANKTSFPSTPFKLSHLFWGLESGIGSTCSDPGSSPARSVLFSGWAPALPASPPSPPSGKVFKLPLSEATANSQLFEVPLPAVVLRCVEYLDNEGLNEVGLYRIPGSSSLVLRLKSHFDTGEDCDLVALSPDPHAVATLLKLFLRELPETILTPRVLTEINLFLVNSRAPEGQLPSHLDNRALYLAEQIRLLVRNIPDTNYYLLHWLTRHLARVDRNSSINKMNTSNLGMIFCPTLGITANLFRIFVTYNHLIFPLPKPPGDAALKRPSPRPYSVSSVSSLPSESAHSSVSSLAGLMKLRGIDKIPDSREAKNALLFENIAALNELAKLTPNRAACYADSATSTIRSRNSILSYQSSPRSRRSRSIDIDTAQQLLIPPSEPLTEAASPRRRNTDGSESPELNKLRSPGILKLDYFDGTHMAHALLNMKIRRANPSISRNPIQGDARARLARTSARVSREGLGFTLADVDLSKTRANLRPVHRPDTSN